MTSSDQNEVDLRKNLWGWSGIAELHRAALGAGWDVAEQFVQLHLSAVREFTVVVGQLGSREQAVIELGVHSLNLYAGAFALLVRGQFDVAPYLMRGLYDVPCLILATDGEEAIAERFLSEDDELKPSDARRWVEANHDYARVFLNQSDEIRSFMNEYSHVGRYQTKSMLDVSDGGITPTFGGRRDEWRVHRDTAVVGKFEMLALTALGQTRSGLSDRWWAVFGQAVADYHDWSGTVRARFVPERS